MRLLLGKYSEQKEASTGRRNHATRADAKVGQMYRAPVAKGTWQLIRTMKRGLILPRLRRVRGKRAPVLEQKSPAEAGQVEGEQRTQGGVPAAAS
jgi:hypothetical protein